MHLLGAFALHLMTKMTHCQEAVATYMEKLNMATLKVLGFPHNPQNGARCKEDSGAQKQRG